MGENMSDSSLSPDFTRLGPPEGYRLAVTGGCGGIGRHLVEAALEIGLEVAVIDLPESMERHPLPDGVIGIQYDARVDGEVERAFGELGGHWDGAIDGFVHLPGYMTSKVTIEELSMEEIDEQLNVNLRSAFTATKATLPMLRQAGGGSVVFTASGLATLVEIGTGTYSASKAGLIALAKGLAKENAPDIRFNCIAPGGVDTAFMRGGTGRGGDETNEGVFTDDQMTRILSTIPLGRMAITADIVGPILFLLSEKSRFMTGQTMYINGGRLMV
jgi:3-oxoacyl-[acyl-carrier protein] reductase